MYKFLQNVKFNFYSKIFGFYLLIVLLSFPVYNIKAQDYQLVWSDEFDGTQLDSAKWGYQIGNGSNGWGNNEREYYRAENAVVKDGYLTIIAKKESYNGFDYTSARIRTIHRGDWKYGKIEMRARMPKGKGIWPAFWMMPTDNVYGGWAASGEIDIMEYLGHDTATVYGTLHYGGAWPNNVHTGSSTKITGSGFNNDFHTFTLIWEEGKMQWLVDGKLYQTQTSWYTSGAAFPAPFDQNFHIILNLAVGGNWPGYPDASTQFPQEYTIDYIRVYQNVTAVKKDKEERYSFSLNQNYPNPFNPVTTISYSIPENSLVKLVVYNILGEPVKTLVNKEQSVGNYQNKFDAADLSSGVYLYKLTVGKYSFMKKMILLK
ncbi:MAG: family 16 glycosylhydrolase [Ignavibacteriaceae bacterium]